MSKTLLVSFFVPGVPATAGSKRVFMVRGRPILTDDAGKKGKDWRGDVRSEASRAFAGELLDEPLRLELEFLMPRPKGHYRPTGMLKSTAPVYHDRRPDAIKLARALEDALNGVVWSDDSRIVEELIVKRYPGAGEVPGCRVRILRVAVQESAAQEAMFR